MAELEDWFCHSHTMGLHSELGKREEKESGMIPFAGAGRHLYLQVTIYLWMKDCGAFTRGKENARVNCEVLLCLSYVIRFNYIWYFAFNFISSLSLTFLRFYLITCTITFSN